MPPRPKGDAMPTEAPAVTSERTRPTGLAALGTLPFACFVLTAINGLYIALVTIGNVVDFKTNREFVRHVLAMDTTNFGADPGTGLDPDIMGRAITNPMVQDAAYLLVIGWEALTTAAFAWALWRWVRGWRADSYADARRASTLAALMIVLLFMGGFITVGGEWFQMWRSTQWNGLDPAFRNSVLALFAIVLCSLPSPAWER